MHMELDTINKGVDMDSDKVVYESIPVEDKINKIR